MTFYNMFFGKNSNSDIFLAILGLKKNDIERYRDCHIDLEEGRLSIYTRTGGGNREDYPNKILIDNPYYLYDEDDEFDSTYATYYFSFPESIKEDILHLKEVKTYGVSGKFITWVLDTLQRNPTNSDIRQAYYESQLRRIHDLQRSLDVSEAFNGHTVVPLSDSGMDSVLQLMESYDGEFIAYWNFLPYKIKIYQDEVKYSYEKGKPDLEASKSRIGIGIIWEIDEEIWDRYKKKFSKKYPKSIKNIQEKIDQIKS